MNTELLNLDGYETSSQHVKGETYAMEDLRKQTDTAVNTFSVEALQEKFSDLTDGIQTARESVVQHIKDNRKVYLSIAIGAVVVGGAIVALSILNSRKPNAVNAFSKRLSRAKRKQAKAKMH